MSEDLQSLDNGRYQLQEILGQGGMAVVYRAWDERLRVERAIKILSPQVARRRSLRKRFENEARTMARLAHPNIVSVTDVVEEGARFFMVMELVTGGTLWDWVTQHGRMPPQLALEYLIPVLDAMGAAHAAGVIHRDIKPQNIMLTADGKPKVTDFGIAHVQDLLNTGSLTRTGSVMGTWGYMSPEQRASARDVDGRSDVYALGATLYAVVTADLPVDLFAAAQDDDVLGRVPEDLHPLVRKATRYRANDRYQDVHEMAAACKAVLAVLPDLPQSTPRVGMDTEYRPPPPRRAPVPFEPTAAAAESADPPPPEHRAPIPLRTQQISEETFDFGLDSEIDLDARIEGVQGTMVPPSDSQPEEPEPEPATPPSDTLAKTPVPPPRHTAVPDITSSEAPESTAPEDSIIEEPPATAAPRWRLPAAAVLVLLGIGVPATWYGLNMGPEPAGPTIEEAGAPTTGPAPAAEPVAEVEEAPQPEVEEPEPEPSEEGPAVAMVEPEAEPGGQPAAEPPPPRPEPTPTVAEAAPKEQAPPEPAPVEPAPAEPEPEVPLPVPEPAAAAAPAQVSAQGEYEDLRLIDATGKAWPLGQVPPGSYKIEARFPGADAHIPAGKLTLESGQSHTMNCNAAFKKCK